MKPIKKNVLTDHPDLWVVIFLGALSLIPCALYLRNGWTLNIINAECLSKHLLYRTFVNDAIQNHFLPTWCPGLLCGFPFIAWAHTVVFSPTAMVYYFFDYPQGMAVSLFLHVLIFNLGFYYLLRQFSIKPLPALTAACGVGFGFYLVFEKSPALVDQITLSFVPWGFGLLYRLSQTLRFRYFIGASLVTALEIFGGQLDIFGRAVMVTLMALVLAGLLFRPPPHRIKTLFLTLAMVGSISLLMTLLQLLPTLELVQSSTHAQAIPLQLFAFLGNAQWQNAIYLINYLFYNPVSVSSLIYALVVLRKEVWIVILLLIMLICVAISTNALNILAIVHLIPVFNHLYWHASMSFLGVISLGIISGLFLQHIYDNPPPWKRFLWIILIVLITWLANGLIWWRFHFTVVENPWFVAIYLGGGVLFLLIGIFYIIKRNDIKTSKALIIAMMVVAMVGGYLSNLISLPRNSVDSLKYDPSYAKYVGKLPPTCRILNLNNNAYFDSLTTPYQAGVLFNTQTFDFWMSTVPLWSAEYLSLIEPPFSVKKTAQGFNLKAFNSYKHGNFIQASNLKFIDYLSTCAIIADHENFRFAPEYHIIYYSQAQDCFPEACTIEDSRASSFGKISMFVRSNNSLAHKIAVSPGDRIVFEVQPSKSKIVGTQTGFSLFALIDGQPGKILLFSKWLHDAAGLGQAERTFSLDLSPWQGRTLMFLFTTSDLKASPGDKGGGWWIDPTIEHQGAIFNKIARHGDVGFYWNSKVLPRAMLYHDIRVIPDGKERLRFMASDEYDPARLVVMESGPALERYQKFQSSLEFVRIKKYQPDRVDLEARLEAPGVIALSDTYFPGWQAFDLGREIPIFRANHAFRGLLLTSGDHDLTFVYRPRSIRMGLWVFGSTLLCALMAILKPWNRSGRFSGLSHDQLLPP